MAYHKIKHYDSAAYYFIEAINHHENEVSIAKSYHMLGTLQHEVKDYIGARKYYEKALAVLGTQNHLIEGKIYNDIGATYKYDGDTLLAIQYFEKALATKEATGKKEPLAYTLNNLGDIYLSYGDYNKAHEYFLKAAAVQDTASVKEITFFTYDKLVYLHRNHFSDPTKALIYAEVNAKMRNKLIQQQKETMLHNSHYQGMLTVARIHQMEVAKSTEKRMASIGIISSVIIGVLFILILLIRRKVKGRKDLLKTTVQHIDQVIQQVN